MNRQEMTHWDLEDAEENIMNPFCLHSGYDSLFLFFFLKYSELMGTEAWNNI